MLLKTLRFSILSVTLVAATVSNIGAASPSLPIAVNAVVFDRLGPDRPCLWEASCVTVSAGKMTYAQARYYCQGSCRVVYWTAWTFKWVNHRVVRSIPLRFSVQKPTRDITAFVPSYNEGTNVSIGISTTRTNGSRLNKYGVVVEGCVYTSPPQPCQDTTIGVTIEKASPTIGETTERPFALPTV